MIKNHTLNDNNVFKEDIEYNEDTYYKEIIKNSDNEYIVNLIKDNSLKVNEQKYANKYIEKNNKNFGKNNKNIERNKSIKNDNSNLLFFKRFNVKDEPKLYDDSDE